LFQNQQNFDVNRLQGLIILWIIANFAEDFKIIFNLKKSKYEKSLVSTKKWTGLKIK